MAKVVFDGDTKQPCCVLIQAWAGGDHDFVTNHFDAEFWITSPGNMGFFDVDAELAEKLNQFYRKRKEKR